MPGMLLLHTLEFHLDIQPQEIHRQNFPFAIFYECLITCLMGKEAPEAPGHVVFNNQVGFVDKHLFELLVERLEYFLHPDSPI